MSASDEPVRPDDPRFLARALAQELNADELQRFHRWLDAEPHRRWEFKQLERFWLNLGQPRRAWDAEAALRSIRSRAADEALAEARENPTRPPVPLVHWQGEQRNVRFRRLAWAAVMLLSVGAGWAVWHRSPGPAAAPVPIVFREVRTDRGETARLSFPDGTEVRLAPESRLRYPIDMLGASRDLDLEGEAYVVAGSRGRAPLVIQTSYGTTRDIGTRFLVRAHPRSRLDVVVVEGKVVIRPVSRSGAARSPTDSLVLSAGTLGTISSAGELRERRYSQLDGYLAWLDGRLAFSDAPITEVLKTIARWRVIHYRVVDPEVGARRFTGSLDQYESLDKFLDILALTANLGIGRSGDTLLIHNDPARPILGSPKRP